MIEFYQSLDGIDKVFFLCALLGGSLFVVRLAISVLAGDAGGDADGAGDLAGNGDGHAHADAGFKILTIQGLTGFFMMFGLVGLALSKSGAWKTLSIAGGLVAGISTVWVLDRTFKLMKGLQSSGNLQIEEAVDHEGTVYLTIPANGTGKVQITVAGRLREFNAVSEQKQELKTGERIRVKRVIDGSVLAVDKV